MILCGPYPGIARVYCQLPQLLPMSCGTCVVWKPYPESFMAASLKVLFVITVKLSFKSEFKISTQQILKLSQPLEYRNGQPGRAYQINTLRGETLISGFIDHLLNLYNICPWGSCNFCYGLFIWIPSNGIISLTEKHVRLILNVLRLIYTYVFIKTENV